VRADQRIRIPLCALFRETSAHGRSPRAIDEHAFSSKLSPLEGRLSQWRKRPLDFEIDA